MIYNKDVKEIIKARHSVRTYKKEELSDEVVKNIKKYIGKVNNTRGIFGGNIRVELVHKKPDDEEVKLGTYGVIKGANNFLVASCKKNGNDFYDLGYLVEDLILYCTSIGLGTVWLGGTFSKSNFTKAIVLMDDEIIKVVCPVGIEANRKSLRSMVFGVNSNKRKDFNQLFFNEDFNTPLSYEEAKDYGDVLEMVRLAPSALNKQPWRIVKKGNSFNIYSDGKSDTNKVDIGIALCHFHLTAKEKGLKGEFRVLDSETDSKFNYVITWVQS